MLNYMNSEIGFGIKILMFNSCAKNIYIYVYKFEI